MDKARDIDLLEQYLRGELSGDAIAQLELRLGKEEDLAKQLAELQEVQHGIRYAHLATQLEEIRSWEIAEDSTTGIESGFEEDVADMIRIEKNRELLGEIQGFEEVEGEKEAVVRGIGRYWWGVAAGVLLLLGAGLFLFQSEDELSNDELFAEYFEPYPVVGVKRGQEIDELKEKAIEQYENQNYEQAIPLLKELYLLEQDTLIQFYYSVALLANLQYEEAIINFEAIKATNNLLEELINWYIFLANLGSGNPQQIDKTSLNLRFGKREKEVLQIIDELTDKEK